MDLLDVMTASWAASYWLAVLRQLMDHSGPEGPSGVLEHAPGGQALLRSHL